MASIGGIDCWNLVFIAILEVLPVIGLTVQRQIIKFIFDLLSLSKKRVTVSHPAVKPRFNAHFS